MVTLHTCWFYVALFSCWLCNVFVIPNIFKSPEGKNLLNGEWAAAYEAEFNKSLAIHQPSIDMWGVLEYSLFNNGREGVLVGQDGWLFTYEEFVFHPLGKAAMDIKLDLATTVQQTLAEFGAKLVVVIVPSKARIYSEYLGRYTFPIYNEATYETFARELEDRNILVVRLIESFEAAKTIEGVFSRTDTHWTSYGTEISAKEIAKTVKEKSLLPSLNTAVFTTTKKETPTQHRGDLMNFLPLGSLQDDLGPKVDTLYERSTIKESSELNLDLFGTKIIPVTLVGTSYSAAPFWNFEGALKAALGADVLNVAVGGRGAILPMQEYLQSDTMKNTPPELVIWEIPERFIEASY